MALPLDRAFQLVMLGFVTTGRAPHYSELAAALGCSVEDGRRTLHDLMATPGVAGWLAPGTDYVASLAPFYNLASQYRVSVDGDQKWLAQCGFESVAVCWVFPGQRIRVEAPCLDCNQTLVLEMRDGKSSPSTPPPSSATSTTPRSGTSRCAAPKTGGSDEAA